MKIIAVVLLGLWGGAVLAAGEISATTDAGEQVILFPDGTWEYASQQAKGQESDAAVPANADASLESERQKYAIYYDDSKWSQVDKLAEVAEFSLLHATGDGFALSIFDRIPIPLENLKNIALNNARGAAPDVEIVEQRRVTVNGQEMLRLKMQGTIEGISFTYFGHYASGNWGALQFLTYTATPLFEEYQQDFLELLNGLVVRP